MRPRASKHIPVGSASCGSAATSSMRKPSGRRKRLRLSSGLSGLGASVAAEICSAAKAGRSPSELAVHKKASTVIQRNGRNRLSVLSETRMWFVSQRQERMLEDVYHLIGSRKIKLWPQGTCSARDIFSYQNLGRSTVASKWGGGQFSPYSAR